MDQEICKRGCGTIDLQFFYFIGRMNPPTQGHIESLSRLISVARESQTKAIIVIGGGPEGGVLSLDDPITFELKVKVLKQLLLERGFQESEYYILEKTIDFIDKIYINIYDQIKELEQRGTRINSIRITQVAGSKDEDVTKLKFVSDGLKKRISDEYSSCQTDVLPIEPIELTQGVAMSATSVRKDAYRFYLQANKNVPDSLQQFSNKYGTFYKGFTGEVFQQILNPLIDNTPRKIQIPISDVVLMQYIDGAPDKAGQVTKLQTKFYVCKKTKQTRGGRKTRRRRRRKTRKRRRPRL
jgi:nicotinamide mononucleotide adenylyltransferase